MAQTVDLPTLAATPDVDDLLCRTAAGDRAAFLGVYDAVAGAVFRLCLQILRDRTHAEDAAQEALVELWRTARRYDRGRGSALTWALTIAHHRAIDRVRSVRSATARDHLYATREDIGPFDEVLEIVVRHAEHDHLRGLVARLTERQRVVLDLIYYGGHTLAETATILRLPLSTVKSRVRDALIRLRAEFEN